MIFTEIENKELLNDLDWNFTGSKSEAIHSLHPYPAKFISDIPRNLINNLPIPKNTLILDPFCGSGVTLIEAQKAGINSLGVDLNPIACLLSRVKTQPLPNNFLLIAEKIFEKCNSFNGNISIPNIPNLDHWFKKEIQVGLAILLKHVNLIPVGSISDALKFCVSSIIVKVSNQESDTRYAAIENDWGKKDVFNLFFQIAQKLQKAKDSFLYPTKSSVLNYNSLLLKKSDLSQQIGLVITSPPYPNAYEYWLYHKYRMWWLGYDPINVKEQEIGARAHYFKKNHQTEFDFMAQMEGLFNFLSEGCVNEAFICFVIGRSKIHGRIIENENIIAEIGEKKGLKHITTIARTIKSSRKSFNLSHARIKEEFIVILQK
jgi:DNA modification methylase